MCIRDSRVGLDPRHCRVATRADRECYLTRPYRREAHPVTDSPNVALPEYLSALNDAQREAATYGSGSGAVAGPLLIIAGAGSGKTNTLAHRVAHLLAEGADPSRILLLTFSRRAADEMSRRVQRIVSQVSRQHARQASAGFSWAGTFHSVGARLLRE